jgi:hypothetical protein
MPEHPRAKIDYGRRHLRYGWWALLLFASLGLLLESLHGFKVGAYLDVSNETRRLMWRLAHAHGALLSVVHILFGLHIQSTGDAGLPRAGLISTSLVGASVLLPGGFFLGGVVFYSGDPGLGIVLVPPGAILLLVALFYLGRAAAAPGGVLKSGRSGNVDTPRPRR